MGTSKMGSVARWSMVKKVSKRLNLVLPLVQQKQIPAVAPSKVSTGIVKVKLI